jgi:hypothetical protein
MHDRLDEFAYRTRRNPDGRSIHHDINKSLCLLVHISDNTTTTQIKEPCTCPTTPHNIYDVVHTHTHTHTHETTLTERPREASIDPFISVTHHIRRQPDCTRCTRTDSTGPTVRPSVVHVVACERRCKADACTKSYARKMSTVPIATYTSVGRSVRRQVGSIVLRLQPLPWLAA